MIKLVVAGSKGKMGQMIIRMAADNKVFQPILGFDKGDDASVVQQGDVVIDFTIAEATAALLTPVVSAKKAYVIGTTGLSAEQEQKIVEAAKVIPIVKSSNMSLGVNIFFKAAQDIARALPHYKVHIQETHHTQKKDAPSGTALQAGRLIEQVSERKVTYESFREGQVVGDHRIIFSGPADKLELFHHAESRELFAGGALQAAQWVAGKKPGLYSMWDVLGLS